MANDSSPSSGSDQSVDSSQSGVSIQDLTSQMQLLTQSGAGKDLTLSETARQQYTAAIGSYSTALKALLSQATGLANYGRVGNLPSAQQTKSNLIEATTGLEGIVPTLNAYISYLNEFENTVNAAFNRLQAEDAGS
jgi:hypothetical protein